MKTHFITKTKTIEDVLVKVILLLLALLANLQVFGQTPKKDSRSETSYLVEAGSFVADEDDLLTMDETNLQYLVRAVFFVEEGNYPKAIETITKAIEHDPKFTTGYLNRGNWYFNTGHIDLAIQDYTQVIKLGKKSPEIYHNRGLLYTLNEDYVLAIKDLSQAIALNPNYVKVYKLRAKAYRQLDKIREAKADEQMAKRLERL